MSKQSKLLWLAAGAIAVCGLGVYLLSEAAIPEPESKLSRSSILLLLKDLKKSLTPTLITTASFAVSLKERSSNQLNSQEIKKILMTNSKVPDIIRSTEEKIYTKYSISPAEFQQFCSVDYKNDPEVQSELKSIQVLMQDAFEGIYPTSHIDIPKALTSELTLKVLQELYEATAYATFKTSLEVLATGATVRPGTEEYDRMTQDMDADTEVQKMKVFRHYELCGFEEEPKTILHAAVQKYKQETGFIEKLNESDAYFKRCIELIGAGRFPEDEGKRLMEKFEIEFRN